MPAYKDIQLSDNAIEVLKRRYLIKDKEGRIIESPKELFIRVADFIALADAYYGATDIQIKETAFEFYNIMAQTDFMPNSPTLMNAGRKLGQLSACFVLPVGDSMEEIFETNKHAAIIHKSGGGTGFSFSRIRPKNSVVQSTSGVASGPVSFMKVYNASTEAVKQGGTRRGANMGILRIDHPDILEFISCKKNTSEITNFNISVAITDNFMEAVKNDDDCILIDPRTSQPHLVDGEEAKIPAGELFDLIVEHAHQTGEPGIVFIDRMNTENPTSPSETIEATNPCGEQPLPPYDSCNLGSINLANFVVGQLPSDYTFHKAESAIVWDKLAKTIHTAVHFLDNVIDQNKYPIKLIEEQTKKNRRIGLGIMGWADMLVKLKIPYNSEEAVILGEKVMAFVELEARKQSSELAKVRGKFPNWEGSVYKAEELSMRNATVTTIAPTGTISIIAGCSSGIEPYYSIAFERNVMDGTRLLEINRHFKELAEKQNFISDELLEKISANRSIADFEEIPEDIRSIFLTSADINPEDHIKMQAAFQKHCDSSVSKTINFPESARREEVKQAYLLAYNLGCKGITIYRDNSRPDQVLSVVKKETSEIAKPTVPEKRPSRLSGVTEKIKTGYGNLYVTINFHNHMPFEVFAHIGKSGFTTMADTEAICRLISLALRSGVPMESIIKQIRGIGGSSQIYSEGSKIFSIPDALAQILSKYLPKPVQEELFKKGASEICPRCTSAMRFDSGCFYCADCGYSNC